MNGLRILMVDDEPEIVESYVAYLRRKLPGSEIVLANSGNQAIAEHEKAPFHVIVSDVRMPDGDGSTLLNHVMLKSQHDKPRFVFMSGFSDVPLEELKAAGADMILEKPVPMKELLKTVQELLGKLSA